MIGRVGLLCEWPIRHSIEFSIFVSGQDALLIMTRKVFMSDSPVHVPDAASRFFINYLSCLDKASTKGVCLLIVFTAHPTWSLRIKPLINRPLCLYSLLELY